MGIILAEIVRPGTDGRQTTVTRELHREYVVYTITKKEPIPADVRRAG
jgi:hypothetical protein